MNVSSWGPEYWTVLHGVAPHLLSHEELCVAWDAVVRRMGVTTPCSSCQGSIGGFVAEVEAATGKTALEHARAGSAPLWARLVHEKVDLKLSKQRWEEALPLLERELSKAGVRAAKAQTQTERQALLTALHAAGEDAHVASTMLKVPSIEVCSMRTDLADLVTGLGSLQKNRPPFAVSSLWSVVLVMAFFHEFTAHEGGSRVPVQVGETLAAFSVLAKPWFPEDAASLARLAVYCDQTCSGAGGAGRGSGGSGSGLGDGGGSRGSGGEDDAACHGPLRGKPSVQDLVLEMIRVSLFDAAVLARMGRPPLKTEELAHKKAIDHARRVVGSLRAATCSPVTCSGSFVHAAAAST